MSWTKSLRVLRLEQCGLDPPLFLDDRYLHPSEFNDIDILPVDAAAFCIKICEPFARSLESHFIDFVVVLCNFGSPRGNTKDWNSILSRRDTKKSGTLHVGDMLFANDKRKLVRWINYPDTQYIHSFNVPLIAITCN